MRPSSEGRITYPYVKHDLNKRGFETNESGYVVLLTLSLCPRHGTAFHPMVEMPAHRAVETVYDFDRHRADTFSNSAIFEIRINTKKQHSGG